MDQLNTQPNQNNPTDQESFTLSNQPKKSGWKTFFIVIGVVLIVALFFVGGMYLRSKFTEEKAETGQAPQSQVPAGFTFPTVNPPATPTSTADTIGSIEKDLNTIDLKTFEAEINKDLDNISKTL